MNNHQNEEVLNKLQKIESLLKDQKHKPFNFVETAKYLSLSQSHLYKLTSQRKIPYHKPNGKYLYFFKDELDEWIRAEDVKMGNEKTLDVETEATDNESVFAKATPDEEDEEPP